MTQTRLYLTISRAEAGRAYPAVEAEFEEDGFALSLLELQDDESRQEISVYADGDVDAAEARLTNALRTADVNDAIARENLPDIDWVAKSLEGLHPVRAGRFFVHGAHDQHRQRIGDVAIEIEAGMAFGTGHHGTTAGCLEMIEAVARREKPRHALDLGTGSAVLAIALAKGFHVPVLATDIDPVAVKVANENVRLNGAQDLVRAVTATGFAHSDIARAAPFDLIVANILARPLMRLAPAMARHVAPGGSLILSGILARQRHEVLAAYAGQRFRHVKTLWREGWVAMHLKR